MYAFLYHLDIEYFTSVRFRPFYTCLSKYSSKPSYGWENCTHFWLIFLFFFVFVIRDLHYSVSFCNVNSQIYT